MFKSELRTCFLGKKGQCQPKLMKKTLDVYLITKGRLGNSIIWYDSQYQICVVDVGRSLMTELLLLSKKIQHYSVGSRMSLMT